MASVSNPLVTAPGDVGVHVPLVPPLQNGDCLNRIEFERRYKAMPREKNAELINGIVYMGSPVSTAHATPHHAMQMWLGHYVLHTPGLAVYANTTVRLDDDNEVQPDLSLLKLQGGQTRIDDEKYIAGGPELVVEIAASTATRDAHMKKDLYQRFGVREYILWRVYDGEIDWLVLRNASYEPASRSADGIVLSEQFPGLVLDVPAMLRLDLAKVLSRLQEAMALPSHAHFVKQMQ
jgi:Uma2 family endonuclease